MFGRLWRFLKRNRGKFFVVGMMAGGTYFAWKYIRDRLQEYNDEEVSDLCYNARKRHHFDSVQRSCNITLLETIPKLQYVVRRHFNVENILTELQNGCEDKLAKWNKLKIQCVARLLSSVYVCCISIVLHRIQFNVIAGYNFSEFSDLDVMPSDVELSSLSLHNRYLRSTQSFYEKGISELCGMVEKATESIIGNTSLKQPYTIASFRRELTSICERVEGIGDANCGDNRRGNHSLASLMRPHQPIDMTDGADAELLANLDHMTEVFINGCQDVLQSCLDQGYTCIMDFIQESFTTPSTYEAASSSTVTFPLAKLIPAVARLPDRVCAHEHNVFVSKLLASKCLEEFANTVYQTASSQFQA